MVGVVIIDIGAVEIALEFQTPAGAVEGGKPLGNHVAGDSQAPGGGSGGQSV